MKVVVVSQRVNIISGRGERLDALDQRLCAWLAAAGYLPVPMPNLFFGRNAALQEKWLAVMKPSALLLSGGNNIGDCPERDESEYGLLKWAESQALPVLGICRGMQMLGVHAGAALVRVTGHAGTRHAVHGEIMRPDVNSYHDFAFTSCPAGYGILAQSSNGEIEAIRHLSLPWEGWMWHPEREANFGTHDIERVKELFL